jgi:hypothetical protein
VTGVMCTAAWMNNHHESNQAPPPPTPPPPPSNDNAEDDREDWFFEIKLLALQIDEYIAKGGDASFMIKLYQQEVEKFLSSCPSYASRVDHF